MCCTRGWHIGFRSPDKNIFLQKHLVWNNLIYYYCRGDTTSEYPTLAIPASSPSFFFDSAERLGCKMQPGRFAVFMRFGLISFRTYQAQTFNVCGQPYYWQDRRRDKEGTQFPFCEEKRKKQELQTGILQPIRKTIL